MYKCSKFSANKYIISKINNIDIEYKENHVNLNECVLIVSYQINAISIKLSPDSF